MLYGTDAIGGVVQFVTKTPEKTGAFVTGEIGENQTYRSIIGADLAENGVYAQIRGQVLETDGTPVFNINDNRDYSYDQKGYSAKFGIEKRALCNITRLQSKFRNMSKYSNWDALSSQDFKNKIVNLKGRIKPNTSH